MLRMSVVVESSIGAGGDAESGLWLALTLWISPSETHVRISIQTVFFFMSLYGANRVRVINAKPRAIFPRIYKYARWKTIVRVFFYTRERVLNSAALIIVDEWRERWTDVLVAKMFALHHPYTSMSYWSFAKSSAKSRTISWKYFHRAISECWRQIANNFAIRAMTYYYAHTYTRERNVQLLSV